MWMQTDTLQIDSEQNIKDTVQGSNLCLTDVCDIRIRININLHHNSSLPKIARCGGQLPGQHADLAPKMTGFV